MIRPMTCLSLLAALGAGLYLYQEKHSAQLLDREINRSLKQAEQVRDRIGLLKAEWALLNEPERLKGLANQHLQLQSLVPGQFARLEDLPGRMPAPSDTQVNAAPIADVPPPAAAAPAAAPAAVIRGQAPAGGQIGPVASARGAPKPTVLAAAASVPNAASPTPKPALPRVLAAARPPAAEAAPAAHPLYAPVMPAYAPTPVLIHVPTVQAASAVQPMPAPYVGSALGMARSLLAAPVPVASAASLGYANAR